MNISTLLSLLIVVVVTRAAVLPGGTPQSSLTSSETVLDPTATGSKVNDPKSSLTVPLQVAAVLSASSDDSPTAKVAEKITETVKKATETIADAKEKVKDAVSEAAEKLADTKSSSAEKVTEIKEKVAERISDANEAIKEAVSDAKETVSGLLANPPQVDDTTEVFEDVADDLGMNDDNSADDVTDTVEDASETASDEDSDHDDLVDINNFIDEMESNEDLHETEDDDDKDDDLSSFLDILDSFKDEVGEKETNDGNDDVIEDLFEHDDDQEHSEMFDQFGEHDDHDKEMDEVDDAFLGTSMSGWLGALTKQSNGQNSAMKGFMPQGLWTKMSRVQNYLDLLDATFAGQKAKQTGTCPVYPVHVGTNKVTITTEGGCQIVIKLKGASVDSVETPHDNNADGVQREVAVSYIQEED